MVNLLLQAHRELDVKDNIRKILAKMAAKCRPKRLPRFWRRKPQTFNLSPNVRKSLYSQLREIVRLLELYIFVIQRVSSMGILDFLR